MNIFIFLYIKNAADLENKEQQINISEEVIKNKNEIIKTKSIQKKIINKPDIDDNIVYRINWLQLLEEKRSLYNK